MFGEPECRWGQGAAVVERDAGWWASSSRSTGSSPDAGGAIDAYVQPGDTGRGDLIDVSCAPAWRSGSDAGPLPQRLARSRSGRARGEAGLLPHRRATSARCWRAGLRRGPSVLADDRRARRAPVRSPSQSAEPAARLRARPRRRRADRTSCSRWRTHASPTTSTSRPLLRPVGGGHRQRADDPTQWLVRRARRPAVGYARGTDRYAAEGMGYVASLGVIRGHRGRGLAGALLRAGSPTTAAAGARARCCTSTPPTPPARTGSTSRGDAGRPGVRVPPPPVVRLRSAIGPAVALAGSDHLVQPPDRNALAGPTERLELVVPRRAEHLVQALGAALRRRRRRRPGSRAAGPRGS